MPLASTSRQDLACSSRSGRDEYSIRGSITLKETSLKLMQNHFCPRLFCEIVQGICVAYLRLPLPIRQLRCRWMHLYWQALAITAALHQPSRPRVTGTGIYIHVGLLAQNILTYLEYSEIPEYFWILRLQKYSSLNTPGPELFKLEYLCSNNIQPIQVYSSTSLEPTMSPRCVCSRVMTRAPQR